MSCARLRLKLCNEMVGKERALSEFYYPSRSWRHFEYRMILFSDWQAVCAIDLRLATYFLNRGESGSHLAASGTRQISDFK